MRRLILIWVFLFLIKPLHAEMALVYRSTADVTKMVFSPGVATSDGIAITATGLTLGGEGLMAGLQGHELQFASIVRFDHDLNLALLRLGDRVDDSMLQIAHERNGAKVALFIPEQGSIPTGGSQTSTAPVRGEKFLIKINGLEGGLEPIAIERINRKASVMLEVIGQNVEPLWRLNIILTAEPKLGFWKKGETRGLNAIPQSTLHYNHQVMFQPFGNGKSLKIPIEIHYIKEENYQLSIQVDSKSGLFQTKIPVRFVEK